VEPSRARSLAAGLALALVVIACNTQPPQPRLSASRSRVEIDAQVSVPKTAKVVISNTGNAPADVEVSVVGSMWLSASPASARIDAGDDLEVTVKADCGLPGTEQGTLVVQTEDGQVKVEVALELSCDLGVETDFDIEVMFIGDTEPTPEQRAVFEAAAVRWSQVITGDLPDLTMSLPANDCQDGQPQIVNKTVDDLLILAMVGPIDGPGKVLGSAGPCYLRDAAPRLPIVGVMVFDSADLDAMEESGTLQEVILHEMGHVLGVGTLWQSSALLDGICDPTDTETVRRFTGTAANAKHVEAGGVADQLIVEADGGPGTACGHWDEAAYKTELMTGFIGAAGNPLSGITAGSLADLGYVVSYDYVDAYAVPAPDELHAESAGFRLVEELRRPIRYVGSE